MKWLSLTVLLIIATSVTATTTWSKNIGWHPSNSNSWYYLAEDTLDLGYVNMTTESFESKGMNFTIYTDTNMTLNTWNNTYLNSTITDIINFTYSNLDGGYAYQGKLDGTAIKTTSLGETSFNLNTSEGGELIIKKLSFVLCGGDCLGGGKESITPQNNSYVEFEIIPYTNCRVTCTLPFLNYTIPQINQTWDVCPYGVPDGKMKSLEVDGYTIDYFNYTVDYSSEQCNTEFMISVNSTGQNINQTRDYAVMTYNMPTVTSPVTGLYTQYNYLTIDEEDEIA